jgi:hypothetical protein
MNRVFEFLILAVIASIIASVTTVGYRMIVKARQDDYVFQTNVIGLKFATNNLSRYWTPGGGYTEVINSTNMIVHDTIVRIEQQNGVAFIQGKKWRLEMRTPE